jgi:hypothetical protein
MPDTYTAITETINAQFAEQYKAIFIKSHLN